MRKLKLFLVLATAALHALFPQENHIKDDSKAVTTSNFELPKIQVVPITDTNVNRQYELYIKLPEAYLENNDKSYPVIYTTDAIWHMEMLSGSTEYMMEDVILVGVSWQKDIQEDVKKEVGVHLSRFRDYSIQESTNVEYQTKYQFGQADNHLAFIRNEVIRYVENSYRTDPYNRTYFGYSLGGVFGAYILLKQPNTFKNYILGSPALEGDIPMLSQLESKGALKGKNIDINVFVSYGTLEKELGEYAEEFMDLLRKNNPERLSLHHELIEGTHQTAFPKAAVRSVSWLAQLNKPVLGGPYLGQKPPGFTAIPFAPGIVNTEHRELSGFFSPDLKEFYFNRNGGSYEKHALVVFKNIENQWSESYVMPRIGRPVFAPDGKTMHLGKKYMERTETGWSKVKSLGSYFEDIRIMRLTSSSKGTFVLDEVGSKDGDGVIRYSRLINGQREAPKPFGKEINTGKFNAHPFIAPDESYMIWDGERESGYGDSDLYISFQQKDGTWGEAINLGKNINTEAWESTAFVTPDGKYLFFNRNVGSPDYENVDIFWVDAKVIEDLRPKQ